MISLEAIDETHGFLYFAASPKNATQRYLYRVSLDGGPSTQVTPAESQGWNTYQFSSTREFAVHTHSNANQPPQIDLVRLADHRVVRNLVDNQPLLEELRRRQIPKLEFTQLDIGQDLPSTLGTSSRPTTIRKRSIPCSFTFMVSRMDRRFAIHGWGTKVYGTACLLSKE